MKEINFKKKDLDNLTVYNRGGFEGKIYFYSNDLLIKIFEEYLGKIMDIKIKKYKLINLAKKDMPNHIMIKPNSIINVDGQFRGYTMSKIDDSIEVNQVNDMRRLIKVYRRLFENLEFLHQNDIIVNDVKVENILIDKNKNPIFIDVDSMGIDEYPPDYPNLKTTLFKRTPNLNQKMAENDSYTIDKLKLLISFITSLEDITKHNDQDQSLLTVLLKADLSPEFKSYIKDIMLQDANLDVPLKDIDQVFLQEEMSEYKRRRK